MNKFLSYLYSTKLMAILFLVFAAAMGVATFIENDYGTETAKALVYSAWWFEAIMVIFALNFFGNIFKYRLYKKEKWVVLAFHLAFVFILLGAGITRYVSYEGIMPIKEGQTSNKFLSEKNYISVVINDGDVQKNPIYEDVLFSSFGKNNFSINTEFKGTDIDIELTDYIPNAQDVFEETEDGTDYIKFVESGGSRHEHYIQRGATEIVHGVSVGFDAATLNTIDIKTSENGLTIRSSVEGEFFRMADQYQGTISKDSVQDFSILAVHNVAGLQFVIPSMPIKGAYKTVSGDKDMFHQAELSFEVTANGETKNIKLRGEKFAIQRPTEFSVGGYNFRMNYGSLQMELPFSIKLNDFQLDKYPGSESAMSYASEVTVIDPSETFDYRIYMNHILNYKGYKFFQSSYNITPEYEESHFSVNHDFWGTTLTYIGYFLLYAGLILILFMPKTRFDYLRKTLNQMRSKKALSIIAALLFVTGSFAQEHDHTHEVQPINIDSLIQQNPISLEHAEEFSKVIIQDAGGRMKPVHTYASELLRKVSKHETFRGFTATQVFLSIQQNPRLWFRVPIIYLEKGNTELRDVLGIPHEDKYAKLNDFFDSKGNYKIAEAQQKAQKSSIKSKYEKDIINVDRRVNLLYSAITGDILRIFPIPNDAENTWVSYNRVAQSNFHGQDSIFVRQIFPIYMQTLYEAKTSNDYTTADEIVDGIIKFQKKYGAEVYPSDDKVELEIAYNKYDVFKKLFSYYMYIGTLMFLFVIIQIFKESKALNVLIKGSIAIILVLFLMHTGGLIARWIVSGHAPWSDAYESMIYVAWATMFFGLIFGRKSSMTIAATAFLASFILMVAHWNWMDPEIANLQPVLNSYWLMIHVAIIVASYGPFALGMILGLIALILMILTTKNNKKKVKATIKEITVINEMALTVGLVLLTIGNFLGGQWANESWGRYWGWDPKETWALISIMIYAFVLHVRLVPGLKSKYTYNMLSVASFASILMTYFGVNFYLSGLHSYASGDQSITPTFVYYTVAIFIVIAVAAYFQFKKHYKK